MTWELLLTVLLSAGICSLSIVGAYWFAERAVGFISQAWQRAQAIQDEAWDRMNAERTIWISKLDALVTHNLKLSDQNYDSARREIVEAQRYMQAVRKDIIKDVERAVGDKLAAFDQFRAADDDPNATRIVPCITPARKGTSRAGGNGDAACEPNEARVTPTNI